MRASTIGMIIYNTAQVIILLHLFIVCMNAYGEYLDPTSKTNVNKVDPLFEENIQDYRSLEQTIGDQSKLGVEGIKSKKGMSDLVGSSEANSKADSLSGTNPHELESRGIGEKSKNAWIDEYLIDYSKPGNKRHQEDAKDITKATGKMMDNILGTLKDIGVDCKSVKGNSKVEPQYFIELKKEKVKNTVYDKMLCQELRNKYSCNDVATLKCTKIGVRYKNPVAKTIRFNGHWLHNNKMNWGWAVHWKTKRWGWHIHSYHPKGGFFGSPSESPWRNNPEVIIADARAHIASHLGVPLEQIGEHVDFPPSGRGIGNISPVGCRWRVAWDEYEFGYTYREIYHVCEQWSEDWSERCRLQ